MPSHHVPPPSTGLEGLRSSIAVGVVALMAASGCSGLRGSPSDSEDAPPQERVEAAEALFAQLFLFTDQLGLSLAGAAEELAEATDDSAVRAVARRKLYAIMASAVEATVEPRAGEALADLIVLLSLERRAFEEHWIPETLGEDGRGMLDTLRDFERRAWEIAEPLSTPEERDELREAIEAWARAHPDDWRTAARQRLNDVIPRDQLSILGGGSGGVFRSLRQAMGAAQQAQLLAERALFLAKKSPILISWQIEAELAELPQLAKMEEGLDTALRIGDLTAERLEELPDLIASEREAILDTTFDRLAAEREALLETLEEGDEQLRGLLDESKALLDTGRELAQSFENTTATVDGLMTRLAHEDGRPLSIDDIARLLQQSRETTAKTVTLLELPDELLTSPALEETPPALVDALAEVESTSRRLVDYVFWRVLILIVVLLAGLAVLGLLRRRAAPR